MILAALLSQTVLSLYPYKKLQSQIFTQEKGEKIKLQYDILNAGATGGPKEFHFNATIDNYNNQGNFSSNFSLRYIMDDTYFDPVDGCILFYAGNEGDVWTFYDASGFMTTTLAKELKGLVVVGEHRYFGTSMPFGEKSYDNANLVYLTVEQAMMDFNLLVQNVRYQIATNYTTNKDFATIVFGGSYGGMLAAWLRMKFPHTF